MDSQRNKFTIDCPEKSAVAKMGGQNDRKCLNLRKLFVDELEKHFTVIPEDVYAANPEKSDSEIVAILPWFAKPVVTEEMVKRMPKLVIVASISAGYNHLSEFS